jgi:hypothetical protein
METNNETGKPAVSGAENPRPSRHLVLLGRIGLPILALLALWGAKTVGVILSAVNVKEAMEENPEATAQTIFVWAAFLVIAVLTYRIGIRFKIWGSRRVSGLTGKASGFDSDSE